jgi:peptidyl-prolyl cis-trans isomerase C
MSIGFNAIDNSRIINPSVQSGRINLTKAIIMKRTVLAISTLTALLLSTTAQTDDVIAIINGVEIPKSKFEMLVQSQTKQGQADSPEMRESIMEVMITREILAQEALRRELDQEESFQLQMDASKEQLLLTTLFSQIIKESEPSEDDKRSEYSRLKKASAGNKEYLVRHILVDDKDTAVEIVSKLQAGENFETLAAEYSNDTNSKNIGGKLDWSAPERFVKPFSDAMVSLEKGNLTQEPVLTDYGYHVIESLDIREATFPAYEELSDQIRKDLITKRRDDLITELREAASIETFE